MYPVPVKVRVLRNRLQETQIVAARVKQKVLLVPRSASVVRSRNRVEIG